MLSAHPDFAVVEKQIKRNPDKKKYNGLTLDTMRAYIATQPDSEKRKAEFEGLLLIAKARGAMYPFHSLCRCGNQRSVLWLDLRFRHKSGHSVSRFCRGAVQGILAENSIEILK